MIDERPRVVAVARESLRPHLLEPVARLRLLDAALAQKRKRETRSDGRRQALVVVGDGGIGKSVILGQLLGHFDAGVDVPGWPVGMFPGAAVLVSCADVVLPAGRPDRNEVDRAFGDAAGELGRAVHGLLSLLKSLRAEHGSVTLLVDTLDLRLADDTVSVLSDLVAAALDIGEVVVTCRAQEFGSYVEYGAPQLAGRLTKALLPRLTSDEVLAWVGAYLGRPQRAPEPGDAVFREKLETGLQRRGSMWEVCGLPVRLALVCEVFAEQGDLPEDLTVTALYDAYWKRRVELHAGRRDADGDAKRDAALLVASRVLSAAGELRLRVPVVDADPRLVTGLRLLASEGVLTELTTGWEFFHQTFAEYAAARWLLGLGTESRQLDALAEHLRAGRGNLWSLAGSVLTQPERYQDYLVLAQRLPLLGPQGAKAHTVAALRQHEPAALAAVVAQIETDVELWPAVLPELGSAPREAAGVPEMMLRALRQAPRRLTGPVTRAFATYLSRSPDNAAAHLSAALAALLAVRPELGATELDQHTTKLVSIPYGGEVAPDVQAVLISYYPRLGALSRQAVMRRYLDRPSAWTDKQVASLARVALAAPGPNLDDDEAVDLLRLFWQCPAVRAERDWRGWHQLMVDDMPGGHWHNAKVKFLVVLARSDLDVRTGIVDELLAGRLVSQEAHINVFERVAQDHPEWLAEVLLAGETPVEPRVVGAVCSACGALAGGLPSATALRLIEWLTPRRSAHPRQVWPTQVVLASRSVPLQRRLFDELLVENQPQPVVDSAVDAWLFRTTPAVVDELAPDLRRLLQTERTDVLQTRARLEGRRAPVEPQAREWVAERVLRGASPAVAGTAVKTIEERVGHTSLPLARAFVYWLASLTATPHTDAARRVLTLLGDSGVVDDGTYRSMLPSLLPDLSARIDRALSRRESPQLVKVTLDCLIRADRMAPLEPETVRRVYDAMVAQFPIDPTDPHASAMVGNVVTMCGTLMATALPADEVRARTGAWLSGFDPGVIARRTTRSIASMLVGLCGRDPQAADWMETLFGRETTTLGVRLAIAEAFLVGDHRHPGGRASRLKDRPDCPPEVVTHIINALRAE